MRPDRRCLLALLLALPAAASAAGSGPPLTVFAAASLTNVLQDVGDAYTRQTGRTLRFSFAGSAALARQIEAGAPADVFVSADQDWMDYLQAKQKIKAATRVDIVSNALVLVAPADSRLALAIAPGFALAAALGPSGRLATGDPGSVPAGKYAQMALTRLGVWPAVSSRIVAADNVRTALNFVARGEAPLGIVYATDARAEPKVRVVDRFPGPTHDPIRYPAAVLDGAGAEAAAFVSFLRGPAARALFDKAGFAPP
jgi:molybdate transport system substrate-binding protein